MPDEMFSKPASHLGATTSVLRRTQLGSLLLLVTVSVGALALLYFSRPVAAVNRTWDGGGLTNNWSDAANWSSDTVPGSGDVAIFDATSTKNATIDTPINVQGIQINAGYTGTITQTAGASITVGDSDFSQAAGAFTGSSNNDAINVNGNFILSGGTFTSTKGTLTLTGSHYTHQSGGAFLHNSGTVTFAFVGSNPVVTLNGNETFNNLNFADSNNDDRIILFGAVVAQGALALIDGSFTANGGLEAQAGVSIAPTFDGGNNTLLITTGDGSPRTITFAAGTNLLNVNLNASNVTINTSGSGTLTWRDVTIQAGAINQGSVDFVFAGTGGAGNVQSGGTFNASANAITFNNTLTLSGGAFNGGSGNIVMNEPFTLSAGAFTSTTGTLFVAGNFVHESGVGAFNHHDGTVTFDSDLVHNGSSIRIPDAASGGETFNNLNFSDANGVNKFIFGTPIALGALTFNDGILTAGASGPLTRVEARGAVTVAPTFDGGNMNVVFSGSANQTFINNGGFNPSGTWTVNKTGGVLTLASDLMLGTSQSLNITSGQLNQGASFNLTVGTLTIEASGTLRNFGTGDLTLGSDVSNSGTIDFNGGGPACGDADSILIRSSSPGVQRPWSGAGTFNVVDVDVQDQAGSASIIAFSSTNSGNNGVNWDIRTNCIGAPTEVTLESFTATRYEDGNVLLEWQTGFEVRNLGFNIYREEVGAQVRINPSMLAGSALVTGLNTALTAGRSYAWLDKTPGDKQSTQYWLEDVDLGGQSTWHGPIAIQKSEVRSQSSEADQQALTLSEIGKGEPQDTSLPLERKAQPAELTAESIEAQAAISSQPGAKIAVMHEGWYLITQPQLDAAGFNTKVDPRLLQLFVDGSELPIIVSGEQDRKFDSTDAIEFYGVGLDSAFTDSRVYWLVAGNQNGLRVKQARAEGAPTSIQSFTATVERRDRTVYFSALRNGEQENFFGAVIAREPVDQQLTLPHLVRTASNDAQIEIAIQGVTFTDHRVSVELNGSDVGEVVFNGQSQVTTKINVAHSMLREGKNTVRLTPLVGGSDVSLVDYVRVSYQHSYTADDDALKLTGPGRHQITIDGFTSKSIRVFDVTEPTSPQEILGESKPQTTGYAVTFAPPGEGPRALIALTSEQAPASVTLNQPSNLHKKGNASVVIITRRAFAESLQPLIALREKQGLRVALVDVEDIYDEFSFGQKTPFAVRDFLAYAKSSWKKKPRFVLFAGDASLDPKNYLGFGDSDLVPTRLIDTDFMETASDDWFTDFDGDGVADIPTGRLPARTIEELSAMVAKIVGYDQSSPSDEALLVADANDGFDFEQATTELTSLIPPYLRITQVNRGRLTTEMARRSLFDALYRRQFLVNYVGHGSVNQWKANLLTNADALSLGNEHLPMYVMMTCLNGYFQDPALDSLAESLLKAERGGAVAVWASSGMTLPTDQALLNQELYRLLFNRGQSMTIGEAVMRAKSASSSSDVRRTWILLGDPAMKLN